MSKKIYNVDQEDLVKIAKLSFNIKNPTVYFNQDINTMRKDVIEDSKRMAEEILNVIINNIDSDIEDEI